MRTWVFLLFSVAVLSGCTTTTVVRGGGDAIAAIRALPESARPRMVVLPVVNHTPPYGDQSLELNLALSNLNRQASEQIAGPQLMVAIQSMLVADLFASQAFIVLDREGLSATLTEQAFAEIGRFNPQTLASQGGLEGAQYVVAPALTAFDVGTSGGAIPIPIPLVLKSDVAALGILNLGFKKGYVALDVRIIEVASGRVIHSTVVEGRNTRWGADLSALTATREFGFRKLPNVIQAFKNTPVETALQKMTTAAVEAIAVAFAPK